MSLSLLVEQTTMYWEHREGRVEKTLRGAPLTYEAHNGKDNLVRMSNPHRHASRPRQMRRRPVVKVDSYYAGRYADGGDNYAPMIRLRGKWIEEVFDVGTRVRVTREERAGKLVLVLETVEEPGGQSCEPMEMAEGRTRY